MAKGAGMLAPSLATMLVVLTTDAVLDAEAADTHLRKACAATFDRAFRGRDVDAEAIAKSKYQPEFKQTMAQYVDTRVSDTRIDKGRAAYAQWGDTLARASGAGSPMHTKPRPVSLAHRIADRGVRVLRSDSTRTEGDEPLRIAKRVRCSWRVTENQNLVRCTPLSTSISSKSGAWRRKSWYSAGLQKPMTRSTPARLYQDRSNRTRSPAVGRWLT